MRLKNVIQQNRILFKNGIWLYILQLFNTMIPLLTLPYITRVLGAEKYGVFSFALNLVAYLQVVVEYGFNLSASRKIAIDPSGVNVSFVLVRVLMSRFLLCGCSFLVIVILAVFQSDGGCLMILSFMVLGGALDQTWLFQGLQKMEYITIINVAARMISVFLIFLFVKQASDLYLYCIFYSGVPLFIGILEILFIVFKLRYEIMWIAISDVWEELKDGWYLFTSSLSSKIFSGIGITVLGLTSTPYDVGIYAAIQKISYILLLMFMPIGQIIYPYISKEFFVSYKNGKRKALKICLVVMSVFAMPAITIAVCSRGIVYTAYGAEYAGYHSLVIPLVIYDFFSILNNFLGIQILVGSGHMREYGKAFQAGIVISVISNLTGGFIWGIYGIALAPAVSELCLTALLVNQLMKLREEEST